ncbi:glycerol-3-phosphate 1-O-acyltransferase PlsY [Candidatus Poribacteria bacterium]|nr:glycerol-3-phosphate 1-O-acyltransferase PlsY [Candidatus Poribacteria bacterium]
MFGVIVAFIIGTFAFGHSIARYSILILLSYLVGAIPFGYIIGKLWKGIDVREHGSGNIGFTNVLRVVGTIPGFIVMILDICKGVVAVVGIAKLSEANLPILPVLCGVAAIIGHNWTIYLNFKGGKGIDTTIGVFIALNPIATLVSLAVWVIAVAITRYVSLGSMLFVICLPIAIFVTNLANKQYITTVLVAAIFAMVFAVYKHLSNIGRLLNGTEHKIGRRD